MVLVQKWPFFQVVFLGNISQENILNDILERKNGFEGYKNKNSKSRKIYIFPRELTDGFCQKMAIFPPFFLGNIGQENILNDVLQRKNAFLGYKNKKVKKSKNWHFSRGVNPWCWSKNGLFAKFFFLGNISRENILNDIL